MDAGQVELWCVTVSSDAANAGWPLLSGDEKSRADRFRVEPARDAYIVTRSALRNLASGYLQAPPQSLVFDQGPQGKPLLPGTPLRFNVSHTAGMAALAFAWNMEVGVDIERIREMHDFQKIADRFFSAAEVADLERVEERNLASAFFRCWTRKEAYIKAVGGGLSIPLDSFRVTFAQAETAPAIDQPGWSIFAWSPAPEYEAAAVCHGLPVAFEVKPRS